MSTLAPEFELEGEAEYEGEEESEEFFRRLASQAARAVPSPALRRVGQAAAQSALGGVGGLGLDGEVELEGEWETEFEGEEEAEWEANPIRRIYPDALMEHLGHRAAETASEAEAEALMSALVPLAARLAPRAAGAIMRASPQLARGVAGITRALRADPAMRPLLRTLPGVVNATARSIAHQAGSGQLVTPRRAVSTLAGQTARTLASPQRSVAAWQRSRALDRSYHRHVRPARPLVPAGF
jgi:hypothetical protein